MKKKICFIMLCMLFLYGGKVRAVDSTCSYSEQASLNSDYANIKLTYEDVTKIIDVATGQEVAPDDVDPNRERTETQGYDNKHVLKISILNLPKTLTVQVTNDFNEDVKTFSVSDAEDGIISFEHGGRLLNQVVNYTFTFYASDETGCPGDNYGTKILKTPMFNRYAGLKPCVDNPDMGICQQYIDFDIEDEIDFYGRYDQQIANQGTKPEENKTETSSSFMDYINDYKEIILVSLGALVVIGATIVVIKKAKSKRGAL